mmetsp:Transcript_61762/g.69120  ORF Transcript_61762/g.69120 Transcript_61762/m.69120 type:complete len:81 (+) Transcript_61762:128-370(+)
MNKTRRRGISIESYASLLTKRNSKLSNHAIYGYSHDGEIVAQSGNDSQRQHRDDERASSLNQLLSGCVVGRTSSIADTIV